MLFRSLPRANADWWVQKMAMNRARDVASTAQLQALGWTVLRFWEHEPADRVAAAIVAVVRGRRDTSHAQLSELISSLLDTRGGWRHARARTAHHLGDAPADPRPDGRDLMTEVVA